MGKMKEIAQIHFDWRPHINLRDILDEDEYRSFLSTFKYDKENTILDEALRWEIGEYRSVKIANKIDSTLLLLGFKPNSIVYLELCP